ncbi:MULTISPECIES: penicillin-binding protein 1A [Edaphosphingomonas]|uniref:Penicillin-binding protein 1A n=2 Tax=Edaphosphingomonas TaxID=3423724 RepID=A0A2T4HXB6_9SPHN|nr:MULTISPECIES: PBP1A family penicillin-binding protein [Sphingomonas]OHT22171.1 Penicillin-binding protein 1A [Sphingomonas haloaromaticamans]PTD20442.1 penicillin-binding protein [Sphingomonas fennica]
MEDAPPENLHMKLRRAGDGLGPALRALWQRRIVRWAAYAAGGLLVLWLAVWLVFARDLPDADQLLAYEPPLPTNVRDIDGMPVHSFARERRVELAYDEYPPMLVHAFLAAEDKTFFSHSGVDLTGLAGAVIDYVSKLGSGERARGGSTITQQVAKNLLIGDEYSPTRKIKEMILARRIEHAMTKQQILELYLNQIFLGRNAYGVQSAARAYFDKDVDQLSLPEMAYLAILPKAPANYNPDRFAARALERRDYVLAQMKANGWIDEAQRAAASAAPLGTIHRAAVVRRDIGGYFMEEVRRELIERYGEAAKDGPHSVYSGGLWVRTSIDPRVQGAAETALRDGLVRYDRGKGWSGPVKKIDPGEGWPARLAAANVGTGYADWLAAVVLAKSAGSAEIGLADGSTGTLYAAAAAMPKRGVGGRAFDFLAPGDVIVVKREGGAFGLRNIPAVSGGFVAEDPHNGRVLAMQGGFDARGSSFNRATQAQRQPGSSFKPFVYAAALDNGMTPASIIVDGPFCVYQSARLGQKCFRNFSGGNAGPQTMRWGVEQSRNLMTVRAASQTGMDKVVKTAKAMGIGDYPAVLAISLGAGDTTVLKLTNAYAMLANNGRELKPTLIDYIQDRNGKTIWRADTRPCEGCNAKDWNGGPMPRPRPRGRQVMDAMTAYQTVHILEGVVQRGTATILRDLGRPLFGKTGTSTGPTNVWFVGGSADLVAGVYLGYDQPRSLGGYAQGGTVAAPIFKQFAQVAMKDMPVVPFRAPPGIRMVRIDRKSGRKVFAGWPGTDPKAAIIWEAFKPESEPRRTIRREEIAKQADAARPAQRSGDSDFLQREGGIY